MTTTDGASLESRPKHPRFPSSSELRHLAPWWAAVLEGVAGAVMVIVSLGAMAASLGNGSIWVWLVTAIVGGLQCILIASLTLRFHSRAGGTPQYAFGTTVKGSRLLGALSSWCYWFAWTPAIAVNLIVASIYIQRMVWPSVNVVLLAVFLGAALYIVTACGLRLTLFLNALLATVAILVVFSIIVAPIIRPTNFAFHNIFPTHLPSATKAGDYDQALLYLKWGFVATWTSYAPELAASLCAEVKQPARYVTRVMWWSASICVFAFCALPIALFGLFGTRGLQQDPFIVFSSAGKVLLGETGQTVLSLGLIVVLLFGAEAFIIGSSRTIYQMSRDGYLPKVFSRVNRRGAPIGSIVWDALVISTMLLVFGTNVVNQVAAANYGYMFVFVLLPLTYLAVRRREVRRNIHAKRHFWMTILAVSLVAFNSVLLVVGGAQWGWQVITVGLIGSLLIIPIALTTSWNPQLGIRVNLRGFVSQVQSTPDLLLKNSIHEEGRVKTTRLLFGDVLPTTIWSLQRGGIMASHQALSNELGLFHSEVLSRFVSTGEPPTPAELEELAVTAGLDLDNALSELDAADLVHTSAESSRVIVVAYPLSRKMTPHTVSTVRGASVPVFAMCAVDALGVLCMTSQPGTVTTFDPSTGDNIRVVFDGKNWNADPSTTSVLLASEIGCCGPISEACRLTAFYSDAAHAEDILARDGAVCGRVLSIEEAAMVAMHEFGGLLDILSLEKDLVTTGEAQEVEQI
jgi:amino acid transporter